MAPSKAISIELKAQQQAILQRELESGHYENASEVIGDALRALHERGTAYDEFLRARVKASLANKKPSIPAEVVFARLEARHARKKKAAKRGA
jgi:antitoxin ParD1/3/4